MGETGDTTRDERVSESEKGGRSRRWAEAHSEPDQWRGHVRGSGGPGEVCCAGTKRYVRCRPSTEKKSHTFGVVKSVISPLRCCSLNQVCINTFVTILHFKCYFTPTDTYHTFTTPKVWYHTFSTPKVWYHTFTTPKVWYHTFSTPKVWYHTFTTPKVWYHTFYTPKV